MQHRRFRNRFPGIAVALAIIFAAPLAADGAGNLYSHDTVDDTLISIDKATGAGAVVGGLGFDARAGQGMDFNDNDGVMYMATFNNTSFQAELRKVDLATGETALIGVLGATVPGGLVQQPALSSRPSSPCTPSSPSCGSDTLWKASPSERCPAPFRSTICDKHGGTPRFAARSRHPVICGLGWHPWASNTRSTITTELRTYADRGVDNHAFTANNYH
jgi:hypothetical protein